MATRRRTVGTIEPEERIDPLDDAVLQDESATADQVSTLLDEMRSFITDQSEVLIYRMPPRGGPWEYIKTLTPPINTNGLLDEIREEWGGGQFMLRVRANGRIVTAKRVNIAGMAKTPGMTSPGGGSDVIGMLQRSSSENMQMMMVMMRENAENSRRADERAQRNSENTRTLLLGLATAALPILPTLFSKKEGVAESMQAFAAMQTAFAPKKDGEGLVDTIKTIVAVKGLLGGGEANGEESFMQTALKTLGPAFANTLAAAQQNAPPLQPALPAPAPRPVIMNPARPAYMVEARPAGSPAPPMPFDPATMPAYASDPVLAAVGRDVLLFAERQYPPDIAAELTLNLLERAGVADNDIMALVLRFNTSPDWIADLAGQGLDLTKHREWATEFISELVAQFSENSGENEHTAGGGGGESDPRQDEGDQS